MTPSAGRPGSGPAPRPFRRGGRVQALGAWLLVVAATAFGLRVADALPRAALGVPRGVVRAGSLDALERATGRRMPVPAFFPDSIEWPPVEARMDTGGSAALWFRQRPAGGIAMILASAPVGAGRVGAALLPESVELQREAAAVGTRPAFVSRVRDAEGTVWQQVQWQAGGRIILIRYRGTLEQLLRMAASIRE